MTLQNITIEKLLTALVNIKKTHSDFVLKILHNSQALTNVLTMNVIENFDIPVLIDPALDDGIIKVVNYNDKYITYKFENGFLQTL
jgi:hypothetical protein